MRGKELGLWIYKNRNGSFFVQKENKKSTAEHRGNFVLKKMSDKHINLMKSSEIEFIKCGDEEDIWIT